MLRFALHCFAVFCFALLCLALLFFALHCCAVPRGTFRKDLNKFVQIFTERNFARSPVPGDERRGYERLGL